MKVVFHDCTYQEITALLKERRKELKLTQETVAQEAGISRQRLAEIENGDAVSIPLLQRIAKPLLIRLQFDIAILNPPEDPAP